MATDELGGLVVESSRYGERFSASTEFVTPASSSGVAWWIHNHANHRTSRDVRLRKVRSRWERTDMSDSHRRTRSPTSGRNSSSVRHSIRHSPIVFHTRVGRLPFPRSVESPYRPPESHDSGARYPTWDRILPGSDFGQVQQLPQAMEIRCDGSTDRGERCGASQL